MIGRFFSILVILLIAGLVLWLVRIYRQADRKRREPEKPAIEPMVACAHCGLHLPQREASWSGDTPYCSDAHRIAGPRAKG